jgi:hypothetical protein
VNQAIAGFQQDEELHWVAQLSCGHNQHVRNDPPWSNRAWVLSVEGRHAKLGVLLDCKKCDRAEPQDR